jgi:hypothetical protein
VPPADREADVRRQLNQLASLRIDPAAQARAAAEMVATSSRADVLHPAAQVLEEHPVAAAREPLISAYRRVEAAAKKLDNGGELRAALLRALRPVAGREDIELFELAAQVYEVSVQGPGATAVRAAALVALATLAPESASIQAARILSEAHDVIRRTQRNTGEPATTAARVLGALGETTALYLAVVLPWDHPDEVTAECVRQLNDLPGAAAVELFTRFGATESDAIGLALVDLVVANERLLEAGSREVAAWLRGTSREIYGYALASFIASRRSEVHEFVFALVNDEFDQGRLVTAAESLELARGAKPLEQAKALVAERLGKKRK